MGTPSSWGSPSNMVWPARPSVAESVRDQNGNLATRDYARPNSSLSSGGGREDAKLGLVSQTTFNMVSFLKA